MARNNEHEIDLAVATFLEASAHDLWSRIVARPNTYVMSKVEFELLDYFRAEFNHPTAHGAIRRFWSDYRGDAAPSPTECRREGSGDDYISKLPIDEDAQGGLGMVVEESEANGEEVFLEFK
jgi:hypothetical protein